MKSFLHSDNVTLRDYFIPILSSCVISLDAVKKEEKIAEACNLHVCTYIYIRNAH